jgi:hypothetical protein
MSDAEQIPRMAIEQRPVSGLISPPNLFQQFGVVRHRFTSLAVPSGVRLPHRGAFFRQ